jgi:hypothetical protein
MQFNIKALDDMSPFRRWVATKAMSYHWHEFIALMWPLLVAAWGLGFLLMGLTSIALGENSPVAVIVFYIFFLSPIIALVFLRRRVIKSSTQKFRQFLEDNTLRPNESDGFSLELNHKPGARFQRIVKNVANDGETYYSAITIDLETAVPEIVLDARRNNRWVSSLPNYYNQNQRLRLEGDFDKYFDLYAPAKRRIEALSIITPDVMQALISTGYKFDLEIIGGNNAQLVISTPGYIGYEPAKLQALHDAFQTIYPEIKHKLRTLTLLSESHGPLHLQKHQTHSFALFGRQMRLYRSMLYLWLTIGLVLGVLYLSGVREYVEDFGILYLGISIVLVLGYAKLNENTRMKIRI